MVPVTVTPVAAPLKRPWWRPRLPWSSKRIGLAFSILLLMVVAGVGIKAVLASQRIVTKNTRSAPALQGAIDPTKLRGEGDGRINVLQRLYNGTSVEGRSDYGTDAIFHGNARPGARTTLIGAVEYSLTNEWVLAMDVEADFAGRTTLAGREGGGPLVTTTSPASRDVGFAPAVEYNWSPTTGALLGLWIIPKGHNSPASVTPAIAISRFW